MFLNIISDFTSRVDKHTNNAYHFRFSSGLQIKAQASGIYTCSACQAFSPERPKAPLSCSRLSNFGQNCSIFMTELKHYCLQFIHSVLYQWVWKWSCHFKQNHRKHHCWWWGGHWLWSIQVQLFKVDKYNLYWGTMHFQGKNIIQEYIFSHLHAIKCMSFVNPLFQF